MKVFQLNSFYHKKTILKRKLSIIIVSFCLFSLNAQIKLRIEPGILLLETDSNGLGLLLNIEPKIKSSENTVIGLRFGIALNPQNFKVDDTSQFFIDNFEEDNAILSFTPTIDYYLNKNIYRPYIGIGLGYYLFGTIEISDRNGPTNIQDGRVNNQLGFLVRGGLELGSTRFGLEYNFIPKADIEIPSDQIVGTVNNSYLGLSIGFTIGGKNK